MERRQGRSKSPSRLSTLFTHASNRNIISEINKYLGTQEEARMRQVSKTFFDKYGGLEASEKGKKQKLADLLTEYDHNREMASIYFDEPEWASYNKKAEAIQKRMKNIQRK